MKSYSEESANLQKKAYVRYLIEMQRIYHWIRRCMKYTIRSLVSDSSINKQRALSMEKINFLRVTAEKYHYDAATLDIIKRLMETCKMLVYSGDGYTGVPDSYHENKKQNYEKPGKMR
jgi:hypothetical protein